MHESVYLPVAVEGFPVVYWPVKEYNVPYPWGSIFILT